MVPQEWILVVFVFALGCCIGSFLNVVIYRLPREKSLVHPGSSCPHCGKPIRCYDNIPLLSWIILRAKCRRCKAPISPRYFIVELLTGCVFLGLYLAYFHSDLRPVLRDTDGAWFVYLVHLVLLAAFIAGSGIDLELWIIPLSICWLVTAAGLVGSTVGSYFVHPRIIKEYSLLPYASAGTGAWALGGAVGLGISMLLLKLGLLKRSYDFDEGAHDQPVVDKSGEGATTSGAGGISEETGVNHRIETLKEIAFLGPIALCSILAYMVATRPGPIADAWGRLVEHPAVAGLLGSLFGYFIGCGIVWATRILGALALGKEAMGLGDVHLMGAAGAVVGPLMVVIAFFVAPFFGLSWALFQTFFKKIRQIPYGPFLSLAVLTVMVFHDWILNRVSLTLYP